MKVLVTGGAGFVGSHLVDALVRSGHDVRIYDNLCPQVHGPKQEPPAYLNPAAEFIKGDMRDRDSLSKALKDVEVVFHEAAVVGVGQSMYEIDRYVDNNVKGTALLLDIIVNSKNRIKKVVVASSMSIYGEGAYQCSACGMVYPTLRSQEQLKEKDWEQKCPKCGRSVSPKPTNEDKPIFPTSVYSVTKRDQEDLCLATCRAYRLPCVALRYFNIYGPRQSISNPYTGVLAIFMSRIRNNNPPVIFEDGLQSRDFIHVSDIVQANLLALKEEADYGIFNIGTGKATNLLEIVSLFAETLKIKIEPQLVLKYRQGDIRHCFADIGRLRDTLGFKPKYELRDGIKDLCGWGIKQAADDRLAGAMDELDKKGLIT